MVKLSKKTKKLYFKPKKFDKNNNIWYNRNNDDYVNEKGK